MRVKLLVIMLVLSNFAWAWAYHVVGKTLKQDVVWRHQVEKERDFWQDQAAKLNTDIAGLHLCRK